MPDRPARPPRTAPRGHRRQPTPSVAGTLLTALLGVGVLTGVPGAAVAEPTAGSSAAPGSGRAVHALATECVRGDLTGDGIRDQVVGDPEATAGGRRGAGAVWIRPGNEARTGYGPALRFIQGVGIVPGTPATGDRFGARLLLRDLDADGCSDLAVSAPDESRGGKRRAGSVTVLFGAPGGLGTGLRARVLTAATTGASPHTGERFGAALAAPLEREEQHVLVVGRPGRAVGGHAAAGAVTVFGFDAQGRPARHRTLTQNTPHVAGTAEAGDRFGSSLAVAWADLLVGVPGENDATGLVQFLTGASEGKPPTGSHDWSLATRGVPGTARRGDRLGAALAVDFNGFTGGLHAVTGLPGRDVGGARDAGAVLTAWIGPRKLSEHTLITQDTPDVAGTAEAGDRFGSVLATETCWSNVFRQCLVVGIPGEDVSGRTDAGAIWTSGYSSQPGAWDFVLTQASPGIPGKPGREHRFGAAVGMGDLEELAIGVPGDTEEPRGSVITVQWSRIHQTTANPPAARRWTPRVGVAAGSAL